MQVGRSEGLRVIAHRLRLRFALGILFNCVAHTYLPA
jgi:hypothetical protein